MTKPRPHVLAAAPHRVVEDPAWGFGRLDPIPSEPDLEQFYESRYHDLIGRTGRGPDLARLMGTDAEAMLERTWLARTVHADVVAAAEAGARDGAPRIALDIGCGTGDLVREFAAAGWDAYGTEPSPAIAAVGRSAGLRVEVAQASGHLAAWRAAGRPPFGAITLLNVLEHVPDPVGLVEDICSALAPGGLFVVRVPNDFSALQVAARRLLGGDPWWIVAPDHINYFGHASLRRLIEGLGFEVVDQSADYPMELFLLMGEDYRGRPEVGSAVHRRRRALELALEPETRRALGRAWAGAGVGRNALLVARRTGA